MISSIPGVFELISLCKQHGVKHVVLSPGSRNAPISLTLENTNGLTTYVVPDERSAGFFAIGISLATQLPVVLVCTSGSAVLNYAPAISEAYYQKVPLIVISADRPQEWINQGDGQTIMQENVFGKHVLFSASLPVVRDEDSMWWMNRLVNEAFLKALDKVSGPVHLNIPFKEPLYLTSPEPTKPVRKIDKLSFKNVEELVDLNALQQIFATSGKVLVLAGQINHQKDSLLISKSIQRTSAIVLSETTSNLHGSTVFNTIDRLIDGLNHEEKAAFAPEILVTIGDAVVSKKVKSWLRGTQLKHHIHIGAEHHVVDTYQQLTHWIDSNSPKVIDAIFSLINTEPGYLAIWQKRREVTSIKHLEFLKMAEWSDLKVFEFLFAHLHQANIHLGNSSPVRYAQLFEANEGLNYYCNRGTSGIDGSASTAVGFSIVNDNINVLITGDISFYYDSNALWNKYLGGNFKIILINNKGGNIFRIIDGPSDEKITQKYFETHQELDASNMCRQFQVDYFKASNEVELSQHWSSFIGDNQRPALLEIFTDNLISPQILKNYFNALKN